MLITTYRGYKITPKLIIDVDTGKTYKISSKKAQLLLRDYLQELTGNTNILGKGKFI